MDNGYSFTPGSQQRFRDTLNQPQGQLSPFANEALKVLSLHLPNLLGGAPIAPDALLRPQPGGAAIGNLAQQLGGAPVTPSPSAPVGVPNAPPLAPVAGPPGAPNAPPLAPAAGPPGGPNPLSTLATNALNPPIDRSATGGPTGAPVAPRTPSIDFTNGPPQSFTPPPAPTVGTMPMPRMPFNPGGTPNVGTMPMPTAPGPGDLTQQPNLSGLATLLGNLLGPGRSFGG